MFLAVLLAQNALPSLSKAVVPEIRDHATQKVVLKDRIFKQDVHHQLDDRSRGGKLDTVLKLDPHDDLRLLYCWKLRSTPDATWRSNSIFPNVFPECVPRNQRT
eukprot:3474524-Rhodomonas_salina.1